MTVNAKQDLLTASLERAASALGDITPHVMAAYYARHPDTVALFESHQSGGRHALEGEMVEQIIYCLMEWFEAPEKIEIIFISTVPHHIDTLNVTPAQFSDLIGAVCDTVVATIPRHHAGELAVWEELRGALTGLVAQEMAWADRAHAP